MTHSDEPWRVGVLFSQTGVVAATERAQMNATLLAIDEINEAGGVLGRPLQAVIYDPASNPKRFRSLAEQLLLIDKVRIIFGCYMSSTRKAVLPVIEAHRGLLFYPTLYEGFEYSASCIYTGAAPNQNLIPLAKFMLGHYGNRVLFVGSNYIYPYESNRIMNDFVVQSGGKVVDELYVPLDATADDFARPLRAIAKYRPDVIFSTVVGSATATFYEAYRRAGHDPAHMPITSLTTSEVEVAEMSTDAAEGHITAAPFFDVLATDAARRFVAAYRARHGADAPVPASAEAAYFQVHIAARALTRAGSDDPEQLIPMVRDIEFDAPQGRVRVDPSNNHTFLWPRVARINAQGRFQMIWNPGVRVKPDPYCATQSLDDWSADGLLPATG